MFDPKNYPPDWKDIRARILHRAKNRCEICGVENGSKGYRDKKGRFFTYDEIARYIYDDSIFIDFPNELKIVLTIAHLKHGYYKDDSDVRALCQFCHLKLDKVYHMKKRVTNKLKKTGQLLLSEAE